VLRTAGPDGIEGRLGVIVSDATNGSTMLVDYVRDYTVAVR
jgi:hypothetical protein